MKHPFGPQKTERSFVMTYDAEELEQYPEIMNKEQLRKVCHISKRTAHYRRLIFFSLIRKGCFYIRHLHALWAGNFCTILHQYLRTVFLILVLRRTSSEEDDRSGDEGEDQASVG